MGPFDRLRLYMETVLALALVLKGLDREAVDHANRAIIIAPDFPAPYRALASAFAHLGEAADAAKALDRALQLVPNESISAIQARNPYGDSTGVQRYLDGLRKAGLPE